MKWSTSASLAAAIGLAGCSDPERPRSLSAEGLDGIHLVVPDDDRELPLSLTPVSVVRPIRAPVAALSATTHPRVAESRAWMLTVDGAQLAAGLRLPVTADGALVEVRRASSDTPAPTTLSADAVSLRTPSGHELAGADAMIDVADGTQLAAVHPGLGGDALAFALDPGLGHGTFELKVPDASADAIYGVRVREPRSDLVLSLQTDRDAYQHGDMLEVTATLQRDGTAVATDAITAMLRAPDGTIHELAMHAGADGHYTAHHELTSLTAAPGELWMVRVSVGVDEDAEIAARRVATTAFAYTIPTARLTGPLALDEDAEHGVVARLDVEVAVAGRYGISGVVMGTDATGNVTPIALSQAATYLDPGEHVLSLPIDAELVAQAELSGPYVVRNLRLVDQTRLGLLHRQDEAFDLPAEFLR